MIHLLKWIILYTVFNSNLVNTQSQDEQESYEDINQGTNFSPSVSEPKKEIENSWNPTTSEFTETPTFDTEQHYYGPSSPQIEYGQDGENSVWQTVKELVSPKATYDPETHFDNLISSDPGYAPAYVQSDKTSIWNTIKELVSPKSTYDPQTHFDKFVSPDSAYSQAYDQYQKPGIWQTIKELVSPQSTYDPETHFDKLISTGPAYSQEYDHGEKTGIWQAIKQLILPQSTYDPETHFDNLIHSDPVYGQEQKQGIWKKIKNLLSPKPTYKQQINKLYESQYGDVVTGNSEYNPQIKEGIWKKVKEFLLPQHVKEVIYPAETSDPDVLFDDFLSKPFVETTLNQISQTKEDFFNRVSQISRKDILESTIVWWKIMYQLLFALVSAVIGGALLVDFTREGGLV